MHVREPQPADVMALHSLVEQLGYTISSPELESRIQAVSSLQTHLVRVAEIDGRIAGFIHVLERASLEKGTEAIVQAMAVDGIHRRAGVGARLLTEAETWAASRGLRTIALHTRTDRADAHAFYQRCGYEPAAVATLMRKALASTHVGSTHDR